MLYTTAALSAEGQPQQSKERLLFIYKQGHQTIAQHISTDSLQDGVPVGPMFLRSIVSVDASLMIEDWERGGGGVGSSESLRPSVYKVSYKLELGGVL